jgi:SAM-dependent methyltransferase
MPNKYVDRLGLDRATIDRQISTLMKMDPEGSGVLSLINSETKLKHGVYSKNYYEPANETVLSLIPAGAKNVLSIGCGSGETERAMLKRGLRVVAVPLDSVVSGGALADGVEMVSCDFVRAHGALRSERFDCIMYSNVLHLVEDPVAVLSLFADLLSNDATVIIQLVNMLCYKDLWKGVRQGGGLPNLWSYDQTGVHLSSSGSAREWCRRSELDVVNTKFVPSKIESILRLAPRSAEVFLASELVVVAKKAAARARSTTVQGAADRAQIRHCRVISRQRTADQSLHEDRPRFSDSSGLQ